MRNRNFAKLAGAFTIAALIGACDTYPTGPTSAGETMLTPGVNAPVIEGQAPGLANGAAPGTAEELNDFSVQGEANADPKPSAMDQIGILPEVVPNVDLVDGEPRERRF